MKFISIIASVLGIGMGAIILAILFGHSITTSFLLVVLEKVSGVYSLYFS